MTAADQTERLADRVRRAAADKRPLAIAGSGSKAFIGNPARGETLSLAEHTGLINYEPTELVMTVRAGTPLIEVERSLADGGQLLPFEPPRFGGAGTIGGAVAAGLAGPRRFATGGVRDFMLGARIINGKGEVLRFGGEVMKNVAGYDVSRLMVGAFGTLGVLLDVSLKVLPAPEQERTLKLSLAADAVADRLDRWTAAALPVTGAAHDGEALWLRLSGTSRALDAAAPVIGGERTDDNDFWGALRDHALPFFELRQDERLWRLALPPHSPRPNLAGRWLSEWGGRIHWLCSPEPVDAVRAATAEHGGHALLFRGRPDDAAFPPLDAAMRALQARLKAALDPAGIFNCGRLYRDF
jgi:glycolate oxidase FAD binding subunit